MALLRSRLENPGTDADVAVQSALQQLWMKFSMQKEPNVHDVNIVNDDQDLDRAYSLFKKVAQGDENTGDRLPLQVVIFGHFLFLIFVVFFVCALTK